MKSSSKQAVMNKQLQSGDHNVVKCIKADSAINNVLYRDISLEHAAPHLVVTLINNDFISTSSCFWTILYTSLIPLDCSSLFHHASGYMLLSPVAWLVLPMQARDTQPSIQLMCLAVALSLARTIYDSCRSSHCDTHCQDWNPWSTCPKNNSSSATSTCMLPMHTKPSLRCTAATTMYAAMTVLSGHCITSAPVTSAFARCSWDVCHLQKFVIWLCVGTDAP